MYEAAYSVPTKKLETPEIMGLMQNPAIRESWESARKIAGVDGRKLPELFESVPGGTVRARPNMEALDYIKKSLDDQVNAAYRNGNNELGASLKSLRNRLRDSLDEANPAYKAARNKYAGDSAMIEAMESGRRFTRGDVEDIADDIARMGDAEKQAFREGVSREIRKMVERGGDHTNSAKKLFSIPDYRNRLKEIFPSEEKYAEWAKRMQGEIEKAKTGTEVLGNSKTAFRQELVKDFGMDPAQILGMVQDPARGSLSMLNRFSQWLGKPPESVRKEITSMLYNGDKDGIRKILGQLKQFEKVSIGNANAMDQAAVRGGAFAGGLLAP